jgi:hypothetical protein
MQRECYDDAIAIISGRDGSQPNGAVPQILCTITKAQSQERAVLPSQQIKLIIPHEANGAK